MRKLTLGCAIDIAKQKNGRCLSKKYKSSCHLMRWQCNNCNFIWKASFSNIKGNKSKKGTWCPKCANVLRITTQDATDIAKSNSGYLISNSASSSTQILKWKCSKGHVFEKSISYIRSGSWCNECSGVVKHDTHSVNKFLQEYGIQYIDSAYVNYCTIGVYKCKNNHLFKTSLANLKNKIKRGKTVLCNVCRLSYIMDEVIRNAKMIAQDKDGICVSNNIHNRREKLLWRCEHEHEWKATFDNVRGNKSKIGTWCPVCNSSKVQHDLAIKISKLIGDDCFYENDKTVLINPETKRKMEIDIWFPKSGLAIEYDGRQHFESVSVFGGNVGFKKTIIRDRIKNKITKKNDKIKIFIRFSYKDKETKNSCISCTTINNKLIEYGVKI